jgi:DNA-directed RNA polymerase III subunit RPC6
MLHDLEPNVAITGDVWVTPDKEYDIELINKLGQHCLSFITSQVRSIKTDEETLNKRNFLFFLIQGYASLEEVAAYVRKSGGFKVEFRPDHIQSILDKLIYDGKIEVSDGPRGFMVWKNSRSHSNVCSFYSRFQNKKKRALELPSSTNR